MGEIALSGCSPDVAIMYLKALGVLRTVTGQGGGDPDATAAWAGGRFVMDTKLGADGLVDFFLKRYVPTPIVSPWNLSSGFYTKDGAAYRMLESSSARLGPYRETVGRAFGMLDGVFGAGSFPRTAGGGDPASYSMPGKDAVKKTLKDRKPDILALARNTLPDDAVPWIDAAYVMAATGKWTTGPLLGAGGSDGKIEFSGTFIKYVLECVEGGGKGDGAGGADRDLVANALFGGPVRLSSSGVVGHLFPGAYEPAATSPPGAEMETLLNPWDYILAMEGLVFFAGSVSKRGERGYPAFPFSVNTSWAGYDTACDQENGEGSDSGEVWFPLWDRPASRSEIEYMFYEGLVQSHKRPTTGVGMAVALANYGSMRGIYAFERYGMFKRKGGRAHHLVSVGQIRAGGPQDGGKVIQEIEPWLDAIRARGVQLSMRGGKLPASVSSALRAADDSIIRYCRGQSPAELQGVLVAIGRLERQIATSPRLNLRPVGRLSAEWLGACNTATPEFRLAASLAFVRSPGYPIRRNLERVDVPDDARKPVVWLPESNTAAEWRGGDLPRSLVHVLERRCMDGRAHRGDATAPSDGEGRRPIVPLLSPLGAPVPDVVRFVEGRVDDSLIQDLLLPLSAVAYSGREADKVRAGAPFSFDNAPEAYAALKTNFPPLEPRGGADPVFEATLIGLLKAGDVARAVKIARRRLRVSGYHVAAVDVAPGAYDDLRAARRLCASLIFPLRSMDAVKLACIVSEHVLKPDAGCE